MLKMVEINYQLNEISLEQVIGGWTALAYIVKSGDKKYFLKVYDKSRPSTKEATAHINLYSELLKEFILQYGGAQVVQAIKCHNGNYYCENEDYILMLFDYIEGETIAATPLNKQQAKALGEIVGQLHTCTIQLDVKNITENFDVSHYNDKLAIFLQNPVQPVFQIIIDSYFELLMKLMQQTKYLSEQVKDIKTSFVICHTDIHGFNLRQSKETLVLLDFETVRYAPIEADFFALLDLLEYESFLTGYKQYHPQFKLNHLLIDYYNYRRKLEDIYQYIEQILEEEHNDEEVNDIILAIEAECEALKSYGL